MYIFFIIILELKKPKVSSVGIVPVRSSQDVCGISVLMEGKSAISVDNSAIGKVERVSVFLYPFMPVAPKTPSYFGDIPLTKATFREFEGKM